MKHQKVPKCVQELCGLLCVGSTSQWKRAEQADKQANHCLHILWSYSILNLIKTRVLLSKPVLFQQNWTLNWHLKSHVQLRTAKCHCSPGLLTLQIKQRFMIKAFSPKKDMQQMLRKTTTPLYHTCPTESACQCFTYKPACRLVYYAHVQEPENITLSVFSCDPQLCRSDGWFPNLWRTQFLPLEAEFWQLAKRGQGKKPHSFQKD